MVAPYQELSSTSGLAAISSCCSRVSPLKTACQAPSLFTVEIRCARISISAMLKMAATRNTARKMQILVMRLCFLCTFPEIFTRSR